MPAGTNRENKIPDILRDFKSSHVKKDSSDLVY